MEASKRIQRNVSQVSQDPTESSSEFVDGLKTKSIASLAAASRRDDGRNQMKENFGGQTLQNVKSLSSEDSCVPADNTIICESCSNKMLNRHQLTKSMKKHDIGHFLLDMSNVALVSRQPDDFYACGNADAKPCTSNVKQLRVSKTVEDIILSSERNRSEQHERRYPCRNSPLVFAEPYESNYLDRTVIRSLRHKRHPGELVRLNSDPLSDVSSSYDQACSSQMNTIKRRAGLWFNPPETSSEVANVVDCSMGKDENIGDILNGALRKNKRHISAMELVGNGLRKLWCEIDDVVDSGLLSKLLPRERQLQEAMFEVITSEASYLRSVRILTQHFCENLDFIKLPGVEMRRDLFSNISDIHEVSSQLMKDLEDRWQQSVFIDDICEILLEHCTNNFSPYVHYCRFQRKQETTLKNLQETSEFNDVLKFLESDPICQGLTLHSFILLPMQRVTRYPLLVEAVLNRLPVNSPKYLLCKRTLMAFNKLVNDCNTAAQQYKDFEELVPKLRFNNVRIPISRSHRWLLIKGEVIRIKPEFQTTILIGTISKNPYWSRSQNHLFLLNDIMLIAKKKKSEDFYVVYDYCYRSLIQINKIGTDSETDAESSFLYKPPECFKNCLVFTFIHNHCGKRIEYYFNFPSEKERINWLISVELWDANYSDDGIPVYGLLKSGLKTGSVSRIGSHTSSGIVDTGYESDSVVECTDEIFI